VREVVAAMTEDRPLYKDIEAVAALLSSGTLVRAVERAVSTLG
jgi:histidine ammonia-lyase